MIFHSLDKYRDHGLLLLRIGIGVMFITHGYPKLAGGPELWEKVGGALGNFGVTFAPKIWGFMAAISEAVGGLLLILGLFTRPACMMMAFTMIVAAAFHLNKGDGLQGASHAIESGIVFLSLLLIGPGKFSFDGSKTKLASVEQKGCIERVFEFLSGECLLKLFWRHNNGGCAIFFRALFVSCAVYITAFVVSVLLNWTHSGHVALEEIALDTLTWFGAIFAGTYAVFLARFASQWQYLANFFNQIRAVEISTLLSTDEGAKEKATELVNRWKAAFIFDAESLHLAKKSSFCGLIIDWMEDEGVKRWCINDWGLVEYHKFLEELKN